MRLANHGCAGDDTQVSFRLYGLRSHNEINKRTNPKMPGTTSRLNCSVFQIIGRMSEYWTFLTSKRYALEAVLPPFLHIEFSR